MADFFFPALSHFQNKNPWSASEGRLRWRARPEPEQNALTAQVWEGPWAWEFSNVEETRTFPLSEAGLEELAVWLTNWLEIISARPARTLAENIARRDTHFNP